MKTIKLLAGLSVITLVSLATSNRCCAAAEVFGQVFCDANGNGKIDTGDTPLGGVSVMVTNVSASFAASATTGADGVFDVVVPDAGDYMVSLVVASLPASATVLIPSTGSAKLSVSEAAKVRVDFLITSPECAKLPPPPKERGCWLTGGGTIGSPRTRPTHSFGGNVFPGCSPTAGEGGQWNHVAHQLGLHFMGTAITEVRCGNVEGIPAGSKSPRTPFNFIEFSGTGRLSAIEGNDADFEEVFFFARAEDRGEPGRQRDRYFLNVFTNPSDPVGSSIFVVDGDGDPGTVDPVAIRSGNLQMHFSSCDDQPKPRRR